MLKKLTIRNFKAIQDMTIEFTPLTVLIGGNSSGKSTVLQAIDILRSVASRDISEYLREKGWTFEELKSQCNGGKNQSIQFVSVWTLMVKKSQEDVEWALSIDFKDKWIIKERIVKLSDKSVVLSYHNTTEENIPASLGQLNIQSSALKYVAGTSINTNEIDPLFSFLTDSMNFDLLSPDRMRSGKKIPKSNNIGAGGETLAACIDLMSNPDRQKLDKLVSDSIGLNIEIKTIDLGNKVELVVNEQTAKNLLEINSRHISDGLLRIIAYAAISLETENLYLSTSEGALLITEKGDRIITSQKVEVRNGMILLDEIEDGINPYFTERVIKLLRSIVNNLGRQVIITTHSPIIVDDIAPGEIVFLWKDENGGTHDKRLFDINELQEMLEFLNPGEAWMNIRQEELLRKMDIAEAKKQ
jgi:predicted ATPase